MTMTFTANGSPIYVDYKFDDGIYNMNPKDIAAAKAANPDGHFSIDPFDTQTLEPGQSWALPDGTTFIRQR
ncbi:hypothetical protein [Variovorax sp. KK3]|uniref:hypothetical protein n=1 Tax=Variovorax sp. KK3 TaxID=1855728 RepID=UPI00097C8921|nr:hypothetical protein [Variovorax sp. KK3]